MPDSSDSEHKPGDGKAGQEPTADPEGGDDEVNNPGDVWDLGAESTHKTDPPGGGGYLSPAADPSIQIGPLAMVVITVLIGLAILLPILLSKQSIFSTREQSPATAIDGGG